MSRARADKRARLIYECLYILTGLAFVTNLIDLRLPENWWRPVAINFSL